MAITTELIKTVREKSGAGMLDCKKALEACDCDVERACDWLREKGIAKAAKKATRIAAEGLTTVIAEGNNAVILEINSETDFVAKSDAFKELVNEVARLVLAEKPACINCAKELTKDIFTNATVKIGEKLDFRRFEVVTKTDDQKFGSYIHMGGKISVLALVNGGSDELAKGIAMSIAANNPQYLSKEDIPAELIEKETALQLEKAKEDPKLVGKPEKVLAGIVQGKVNKYFADSVLLAQEYLLDPSQKVENVLKSANASIASFVRFQVGEGIQKREENFAEEVAKQMN
jgi:elongation factor Ts